MLTYFDYNRLKLNLGKLIINCKNEDFKCKIYIQNVTLEYKNILSYLGAFSSKYLFAIKWYIIITNTMKYIIQIK